MIHEVLGGTPEKAALQAYDDDSLAWKDYFTPIFDQALIDHYRRTTDFAVQEHLIRTPLRAEDLLQAKFVTTALKDLQLDHFWTQVPLAYRCDAGFRSLVFCWRRAPFAGAQTQYPLTHSTQKSHSTAANSLYRARHDQSAVERAQNQWRSCARLVSAPLQRPWP